MLVSLSLLPIPAARIRFRVFTPNLPLELVHLVFKLLHFLSDPHPLLPHPLQFFPFFLCRHEILLGRNKTPSFERGLGSSCCTKQHQHNPLSKEDARRRRDCVKSVRNILWKHFFNSFFVYLQSQISRRNQSSF